MRNFLITLVNYFILYRYSVITEPNLVQAIKENVHVSISYTDVHVNLILCIILMLKYQIFSICPLHLALCFADMTYTLNTASQHL
jgi:hypothetical protein